VPYFPKDVKNSRRVALRIENFASAAQNCPLFEARVPALDEKVTNRGRHAAGALG
jgi:hypothetical protein